MILRQTDEPDTEAVILALFQMVVKYGREQRLGAHHLAGILSGFSEYLHGEESEDLSRFIPQ